MPPSSSSRRRKRRPWLDVLRWAIGAAAMMATWGYGAWKGGNASWIAIPAGGVVMVCVASALTVPVVTAALVAAAFLYGIDSGIVPAIRNAAAATIAIGLFMTSWQIVRKLMERDRRR